jgi:peptide chain release factor 2
MSEILDRIQNINSKINEHWKLLDVDGKYASIKELEDKMSLQGFWDNKDSAKEVTDSLSNLKRFVDKWADIKKSASDTEEIIILAEDESDASLLSEAEKDVSKIEALLEKLEIEIMLSGKDDKSGAYLTMNAGAGGTEACDWVQMLLRMYIRWAEKSGYSVDIVEETPGDEAGIKSVTVKISGEYAYGYLTSEIGVHRLVRISPFDSNARRHTSFVSVFIFPEVDDNIEVEINQKDLRIDTYRASGAGGQHINKTDSAVRITHIPTGIVVSCQNQRSQHQNRDMAMRILKSKLYNEMLKEREQEKAELEASKKKIEWGSQIRSYTFQPYTLVKDTRTKYEVGDIQSVMDGDIDGFINAFLKWRLDF